MSSNAADLDPRRRCSGEVDVDVPSSSTGSLLMDSVEKVRSGRYTPTTGEMGVSAGCVILIDFVNDACKRAGRSECSSGS